MAIDEKQLELIHAGVNVFRLNMAHGTRPHHEAAIDNIRWASDSTGLPVGILVDLAGPKIRLGKLAEDPLKTNSHINVIDYIKDT